MPPVKHKEILRVALQLQKQTGIDMESQIFKYASN